MAGFIEKHAVWSDEQRRLAAELGARIRGANLRLIRLAWADPHGASRAKAVTVPVFLEALKNGYNINVATTTLDSAGGRVFASFTQGGGMGLEEMTGSPNLSIVPDPATFRVLPWAPGVGWILCDEYFNNGKPFHFSPRQLLKRLLRDLHGKGHELRIGLEVEWYLARVAEESLNDEHVGIPGLRGRPIRTSPAEPGYSYHSESNMDLMQPVLGALAETYEALGLPLRSIENEWGPGQVECTFSAAGALQACDDLLLFRTATRQVCRRLGHFATFMARPALKGYYASGWHLHQSLVDAKTGENRFTPVAGHEPLSALGRAYSAACSRTRLPQPYSPHRRSMAIGASNPIRSPRIGPAGPTITAAPWYGSSAARAIRRRAWRTAWASPRRIPICSLRRKSLPASMASSTSATPGRRISTPTTPGVRCCRRSSPKRWMRWTRTRCSGGSSGTCSSTIT